MTVSELRKILKNGSLETEVEFEHHGKKVAITGYTVERAVDGSATGILLKTRLVE